jgi:nucleolar protein 12
MFTQDRACVDELFALEETKPKFAKCKLRVQRCKTLPSSSTKSPITVATPKYKETPIVIPKGDPLLEEKLAGLLKDERKSTDMDCVARRLAKKKARMALTSVKSQGKDREHIRPT